VIPSNPEGMAVAVDRELIRRGGLVEFGKRAWHLVEPGVTYVPNWHAEELCRHLEACVAGYHTPEVDARKLLINIPPGCTKSLWTSVFLLPWVWTIWPGFAAGHASFDFKLVRRDARKALLILQSDWYRKRWPEVVLRTNSQAETEFFNTKGGLRYATTIESGGTGWHFDMKIVDDPTKPLDTVGTAETTSLALETVKTWWSNTMSTRNKDPKNARYCVIMQRLHENDLAGHLLETDKPCLLKLPMRFVEADRCWNEGIGGDRRRTEGELLYPARYPEEAVAKLEYQLGIYAGAQLQQNPVNAEGEIFQGRWFKYYSELPRFNYYYMSVDCSFKSTSACDYVAIQIWGKSGPNFYLVHEVCERLSFTETLRVIRDLLKTYRCGPKLIEDKANGPAVIDTLGAQISGIIPRNPSGGKQARARAVTHYHQAGNVWYPHPNDAPWVVQHIAQLLGFPKARNDDSVDAETQFLFYMTQQGSNVLDAMQVYRERRLGRFPK
jgi:predicted phage terminase large subunit-like protein